MQHRVNATMKMRPILSIRNDLRAYNGITGNIRQNKGENKQAGRDNR